MSADPRSFMYRCLELARRGEGHVSPNPMVGCVIVHNGKIIGEGWHREYGGPHAEVNAIDSVADKSLLPESSLFVSLEPCSIFGKTPPCADLIIKHRIPRVAVATLDDNPRVSGNGVKRLREHGILVDVGMCEKESRHLNRFFITYHTKHRPYIHLKWAKTADGFIAPEYGSAFISNEYARRLTHRFRHAEDAILIGRRTAQLDDPQLTDRFWNGRQPLRVVLDPDNRLPGDLRLFTDGLPTLVINSGKEGREGAVEYVKAGFRPFLPTEIAGILYARGIQSVLVEGGADTLKAFLREGLFDEITEYMTHFRLGLGIAAPEIPDLEPFDTARMGNNLAVKYVAP